jgi:general secretion pathway protein H
MKARGFTLFEMLIVLVIVGLSLGLVLSRGAWRSPGLEARATADRVAGALRLARSQAIAGDHAVYLVYDAAAHAMAVDGGPIMALPADMDVAMTTINSERLGGRIARIGFAPDGSSTGGRIVFARGVQRISVGVDWLTGRVTEADAR